MPDPVAWYSWSKIQQGHKDESVGMADTVNKKMCETKNIPQNLHITL